MVRFGWGTVEARLRQHKCPEPRPVIHVEELAAISTAGGDHLPFLYVQFYKTVLHLSQSSCSVILRVNSAKMSAKGWRYFLLQMIQVEKIYQVHCSYSLRYGPSSHLSRRSPATKLMAQPSYFQWPKLHIQQKVVHAPGIKSDSLVSEQKLLTTFFMSSPWGSRSGI